MQKLKNRFGINEWSGAIGDLGTLLPLAFALVVFNGYGITRLFFLWGIIYIITGWFYKIPVSVQPLKAMSVIAISAGFSVEMLAGTSIFYGILLLALSLSGLIRWLQQWFSVALVKGIQLGIGLILSQKAIEMVYQKGFLLSYESHSLISNLLLLGAALIIIAIFQFRKKIPVALIMIFLSVFLIKIFGKISPMASYSSLIDFSIPEIGILPDVLVLLIIPQLPLTLGNAMYAAADASHSFWGNQAQRATPTRFGISIGLSNIFCGFLGGFSVCHGAGGIAAHKQFGAQTGGATIIMGSLLLMFALYKPFSELLFLIPVPLLAAMLLFDSWRMIVLTKSLAYKKEIVVAILVGIVSFLTRNLTIALVVGFIAERSYEYFIKQKQTVKIKE